MSDATQLAGIERSGRRLLARLLRWAGSLLIVAGVLALAWVATVWLWQDPFTALYTHWQQTKLSSSYERRVRVFMEVPAKPVGPTVADERHAIAVDARRYRLDSHEGEALGRIKIPRIGLNMVLVNGTSTGSLEKGPGRDLETYMPGEGQLVYIAGHRTTYLAPFSRIDQIRRGDPVTIELPYGTFVYRVTGHVIVPADDLARLRSHGREVLALQACHPRFFATDRYIVYAKPVRVIPRRGAPYAAA
ncbi:MAG TPA: class D sortase [Gaiellaceae bacterium]|nr:class D sortase [Gaiellaceae bacterium]